jgi:peptidoglycan hydrolase-like protein with peptidoglycan-binding domain
MTPRRETRAEVGLVAPVSRPRFPGPLQGCTAHWNGPPLRLGNQPHSACQAAWRNIQRFHMGRNHPNPLSTGRHWQDIAYTFAVCHHMIAMDGRGEGVRTAANGTNAGNNTFYACFFMVGTGEEPSGAMLAVAEWYARTVLKTRNWNRHTDHKATTCAGTVNKYIVNGRITTQSSGGSVLRRGDQGSAVRAWQQSLRSWNRNSLPKFGIDGDFGAETEEWTKTFQAEVGIGVDGIVGSQTRATMEKVLGPEPKPTPEPVPNPGPFRDVPTDHLHVKAIERVKELGLMTGHPDGTFRPSGAFTRAQAAAVITRLYELLKK